MKNESLKTYRYSHKSGRIVASIVCVIAVAIAATIGFTHLLQKSTVTPMQTVPADVVYLLQINDNEDFVKTSLKSLPYLNEVLSLKALNGFEFFADQIAGNRRKNNPIVISGHLLDGKLQLLFATQVQKNDFDDLLQILQINPKNHTTHRHIHIYEIATHHNTFYLCHHDGIFAAAENLQLLHASIDCTAGAKCLPHLGNFKELSALIVKNDKQNWLIINHENFVSSQWNKIAEEYQQNFARLKQGIEWSAYQITFTDFEMCLSGYSTMKPDSFYQKFEKASLSAMSVPDSAICANISRWESYHLPFTVGSDSVRLQFSEFHYFTVNDRERCHRFLAVRSDTSDTFLTAFFPKNYTPDSAVIYKKHAIYPNGSGNFVQSISAPIDTMEANFFVENHGNLIFADSISSLKFYFDNLAANNSIETNQLYIFARRRLPSESVFEFFYQNRNLRRCLSADFLKENSKISTLRAFAFHAMKPVGKILPNMIYIRFQ